MISVYNYMQYPLLTLTFLWPLTMKLTFAWDVQACFRGWTPTESEVWTWIGIDGHTELDHCIWAIEAGQVKREGHICESGWCASDYVHVGVIGREHDRFHPLHLSCWFDDCTHHPEAVPAGIAPCCVGFDCHVDWQYLIGGSLNDARRIDGWQRYVIKSHI